MNRTRFIALLAVAAAALLSAFAAFAQTEGFQYRENPEFQKLLPNKVQIDSASYLLGLNFGMMIQNYGFGKLNYGILMDGMQEAVNSKGDPNDSTWCDQFRISPMEMGRILDGHLEMMSEYKSARNGDMGKAFVAFYMRQHPDAKRTESGVVYRILQRGNGHYATSLQDTVVVDYKGILVSGKEFDSNEDAEFPLDRVISGWGEGMQLIDEGGTLELVIPGDLAYGERGARGIEPNSTLIFTVKLREVKNYEEYVEQEEDTANEVWYDYLYGFSAEAVGRDYHGITMGCNSELDVVEKLNNFVNLAEEKGWTIQTATPMIDGGYVLTVSSEYLAREDIGGAIKVSLSGKEIELVGDFNSEYLTYSDEEFCKDFLLGILERISGLIPGSLKLPEEY